MLEGERIFGKKLISTKPYGETHVVPIFDEDKRIIGRQKIHDTPLMNHGRFSTVTIYNPFGEAIGNIVKRFDKNNQLQTTVVHDEQNRMIARDTHGPDGQVIKHETDIPLTLPDRDPQQ